ncbi:MAG TPA: LLM class flavin-dependent oxidoreductase [Hyphomicrobiaceae bacterium]|nr:LLM class flavin-dependent oxidoreductase [Hyphomicrobiaceae bacterium]
MKLMWFHLMPYTELPDDFRQKHPSVWVDIHSSLFDPKRAHLMYNDFMDELEYAAECGFDAICVNEHHSNGYGLMPSPNLIASSLARRTRDTAICVMGNSLALYNPPTRVAEEFAMIDCISGGRLIAGFPVGTPMDTCYAYGQNPSMLRERYLEAHDLVMKAWQEKETFAFNGRFNQQRYVNIWPRPIQEPHPPVWVPGGGSVETWRWCAEMDYVYCYLSYYGYKAGQATMKGFWDEMARLGKDRNPYRAGFLQFVGVAESRSEAMERYAEAAEYFYGRCLHVDPRFATPPGYNTEATQRVGLESQVRMAAEAAMKAQAEAKPHGGKDALAGGTTGTTAGSRFSMVAKDMADIVDRGYVIVGSPKDVAEQLEHVAKTLNVGHFMMLLQFGNMSKELTKYNTKLFAEQVMPKLRPLFADWEDRWWPKPMAEEKRAIVPAYRPSLKAAE